MAITVKHKFVSAIPDAGDTTIVQPSNWNDSHDLVGTVPPANGGTGASTLTGYVKGNGTATMTASATVPSTDITGLGTMSTQNANAIAVTGGTMSGVSITGYIPTTEKAVANGVATLDGGGTVPVSQLPAAVLGALSYQGTWNASTNTPTLTSSVGTKGYYYVVNVAGSTNLNGITDWQIGDWAVYNGSAWQKIDNTDAVTSVNGYTGTVVLGYGDITTGVVPVVNGGTGVTVSSGANSVVLRDANVNINANALDDGYSNIAASGTPIVLTTASVRRFTITGSGGQTIKLPDATTLTSGAIFQFDNNQSSGAITVNNNSNTLIVSVPSGGFVLVNLLSNATAAGSWDRHDQAPSNVSWSTNTFDYAGSFTSGTWNGNAVAYNRGGTGQSSAFTAGGIVYGSTTSALAVTSIGTTGQVLTSAGAGTPTWTTPTTGTVTSVTGTSPVVSSGGNTPAISMPAATTSVSGYLTSTDWTTFNNKGSGTVTSVSGTSGRITSTGGTTPVIDLASGVATAGTTGSSTLIPVVTIDTYGRVTSITTASNPQGTVTSVTGTAPVVSSGGATPAISMAAANTTTNGYLTSTDWNTFNGKGSGTVTSVSLTAPSIFTVTGSPVTSSGTLALTYSGTALPILNGGTGQTTASAAFNALSPITTTGDLILGNGTNSATRLGIGASTYVLTSNGTTASWAAPSGGSSAFYTRTSFTATAGQTTFTVSYTAGQIQVYVNGVMLNGADYTATNGTSVVLAVGRATNDIVEMVAFTTGSTISTTGALVWQSVKTANFTAVSGNAYPVNTTSGAVTVTLPSSPAAGAYVTIVDYAGTAATNNITVAGNSSNIQGTTTNVTIAINRQAYNFVYIDATQGWISYAQEYNPASQNYTATYLIAAGGGGGGASLAFGGGGGGGGAGGLVTGTTALTPSTVYTITVGAGGAGGSGSTAPTASTNSTLTGGTLSLTAAVNGGAGGYWTTTSTAQPATSGGSGGGGAGSAAVGSGTSGQGFAGGTGVSSSVSPGGGGGGSSAVGSSYSGTTGGAGGAGTSNSITGSAVIYAAGGGGGAYTGGTGGAGGSSGVGGAGSVGTTVGGAGTINTGSGGGGGACTSGSGGTGGAGGKGVVIISVPTANYTGTTTGSPTVTTSGSNKILTFTSSGTYTA